MVLEGAVLEEGFLDGAEIDSSEIVDGPKLSLIYGQGALDCSVGRGMVGDLRILSFWSTFVFT